MKFKCIVCGKEKEDKHTERNLKYCSIKCCGIDKRNKPSWNKDKKMSKEYREKCRNRQLGKTPWNKGLPSERQSRWTGGNRQYWQGIARKMCIEAGWDIKGKIVHHKNGDFRDNRLDNFEIMTRAEHLKLHNPLKFRWG